jgi:hypothetical protein
MNEQRLCHCSVSAFRYYSVQNSLLPENSGQRTERKTSIVFGRFLKIFIYADVGREPVPLSHWDCDVESHSRRRFVLSSFCIVLSCVGRGLVTG